MILFEIAMRLRSRQGRAYPVFLSQGFTKVPVRHDIRPDVIIPVQHGDAAKVRTLRAPMAAGERATDPSRV